MQGQLNTGSYALPSDVQNSVELRKPSDQRQTLFLRSLSLTAGQERSSSPPPPPGTLRAPVLRHFIHFLTLRSAVQPGGFPLRTRARTKPSALTSRPGLLRRGEPRSLPAPSRPQAAPPHAGPRGALRLTQPPAPLHPRQRSSWLPVLPPPAAACPAASPARTPGWSPSPSLPAERGVAGGGARLATVTTARCPACTAAGPVRRVRIPPGHLTARADLAGRVFAPWRGLEEEEEEKGATGLHLRGVAACVALNGDSRQLSSPRSKRHGREKRQLVNATRPRGVVVVSRADRSIDTPEIPCQICGVMCHLRVHTALLRV